tara:strand:- start:300 stop:737 length:438 start_codon:yes stop_codon:yes gene_type:complete
MTAMNVVRITKSTKSRENNDYANNQPFWYGDIMCPAIAEYMRVNGGKLVHDLDSGHTYYHNPNYGSPKKSKVVALARANMVNHGYSPEEAQERIRDNLHQLSIWLPSKKLEQKGYCGEGPKLMLKWLQDLGYSGVVKTVCKAYRK